MREREREREICGLCLRDLKNSKSKMEMTCYVAFLLRCYVRCFPASLLPCFLSFNSLVGDEKKREKYVGCVCVINKMKNCKSNCFFSVGTTVTFVWRSEVIDDRSSQRTANFELRTSNFEYKYYWHGEWLPAKQVQTKFEITVQYLFTQSLF